MNTEETFFGDILELLARANVRFILIGGVVEVFGVHCRCVTLERLILLKRAAGRPKDFEPLAELQSLLDERRKLEPPSSGGRSASRM